MILGKVALIIGVKGQDGQLLMRFLYEKGYGVVGVDRHSVIRHGVEYKETIDILDFEQTLRIIEEVKPTELYYLAAYHHSSADRPMDDAELLENSRKVHVQGLENILKAIEQSRLHTRVLYASSCLIFGESDDEVQTEETVYKPNSAYAITKVEGMDLCKKYRESHGVYASNVILYNHESSLRPDIFISKKIVKAALDIRDGNQEKLVVGDLSSRADWGYAPDYVEAMHVVLQLPSSDDFIIATGEPHSVQDWVEIAFAYCGLDWKQYVKEDRRIIKAARKPLVGDSSKLSRASGWKPKTDFMSMVISMLKDLVIK